jgi:hypothetical protein
MLIKKATGMDCIYWSIVDSMADKAETAEAREILQKMAKTMYHKEEWEAGLL